ncbi:Uncharacterized protein HZ326_5527 [Fusarium oxysporum f. sp. albedinis]|nr:Uncharacterized protein HZ326_5527 [Fusarium oxysporum f. sp. albedinis]
MDTQNIIISIEISYWILLCPSGLNKSNPVLPTYHYRTFPVLLSSPSGCLKPKTGLKAANHIIGSLKRRVEHCKKLPEMDGFGGLSQIFISDLLFTNSQENHGHSKTKGLGPDQG